MSRETAMRLAFSTLACSGWSHQQVIDIALRCGYEGLEMRLLDGEIIQPDLPASKRKAAFEACQRSNLAIIGVGTSVSLAQPDRAEQQKQITNGMVMLDLAAEWGASFIRVFAAPPAGTEPLLAFQAAADTLSELAVYGSSIGVNVLLETHDAFPSGDLTAKILEQVRNDAAGAIWDILHTYRTGESPACTAERLGTNLQHVHIKDGIPPAQSDAKWQLVLLGKGSLPVVEILSILKKQNYKQWLSVEWEKHWHPNIEDAVIALPQYITRLQEYLRQF